MFTILEGARIGKTVLFFFPGAVITAIPQDLKFNGEDTFVEIGITRLSENVFTINRGTSAKERQLWEVIVY